MARGLMLGLGALAVSLCATTAHAGFQQTYIALGDSIAFGVGFNQSQTDIRNGDRGYVNGLANMLSTPNGGVRPNLLNLAIPGESSGSYRGIVPNGTSPFAYMLNTNYPQVNAPTQRDFVLTKIASEIAASREVRTISIQLGANDLFGLALSPAFQGASPSEQQAMVGAMFQTFVANYQSILVDLKTAAPTANLVLMGYYNPYTPYETSPTDPRFPFAQFAKDTIPFLNSLIQQLAAGTPGATFVDLYPLFLGREKQLTYIDNPDLNVHPTPLGFSVITGALTAVPEPSSFALLGLGGVGLAAWRLRRPRGTA